MAITDYKITAEDIAKYGVVSLPDTLNGDPQENKKKFDRLVRECVANAVNAVIDHMALVETEANEWSDAEAARAKAEAARVAAENLRVQAENDRAGAETARAAAETARALAENLRAEAETARANAENKRDTAEKSRAAAESGRGNAESARVTAESQRANAESVRAQNEAARVSAETGRADAEADRVSAEDTRIANENARKSAETDRASAETARAQEESARKSAETGRVSAEMARDNAESTRQTSENARVSAEQSRADAETARQTAEAARNVWEEYSAGKAYVPGNKVSFNGSSYVCTAATTGHAPTDTAYWLLIAQKGADGKGAGDMLASVYDPKGRAQDVFDFAVSEAAKVQKNLAGHTSNTNNPHEVTAAQIGALAADTLGQPGGPAQLGADGKLPAEQLGDVGGGGSLLTLRFASAFLGCAWTLTGGGETYSGTVDSGLTATASVKSVGTTYTLAAELDGVTYTEETTTGAYFTAMEMTLPHFHATITVTVETGSTVTASCGDKTYTRVSSGTAIFAVNRAGTWTINAKAADGTHKATATAQIAATGDSVALTIVYANVFGVEWNMANSSTVLRRLGASDAPVTQTITTEPVPAVGTGEGSSPFDDFMPWAGMKECNLNADGTVKAWKGEAGFSRTSAQVMVWIPEFYVRIPMAINNRKKIYISDQPLDGFVKHPGSGKFVGRYTMNSNGYSVSGNNPWADITRPTARTKAKSIGEKFHLYDFAAYCAIVLLYVVEFADWNCQSKIGRGYTTSNVNARSGHTDSMTFHTGRESGTDGKTAVQYRWIENLWGNVYQWVDGFNANGREAYYCTDPSKYADDTTTGYTQIGTLPASGWIKDLTVTVDGLLIPDTTGGSESTYIPDYVDSFSDGRVLQVGGSGGDSSYAGLLCFNAYRDSSYSSSVISARLMRES